MNDQDLENLADTIAWNSGIEESLYKGLSNTILKAFLSIRDAQLVSLPDEKDVAHYLCSSTSEFNRGVIECYRFCRENMKPVEKQMPISDAQLVSLPSAESLDNWLDQFKEDPDGYVIMAWIKSQIKTAPKGKFCPCGGIILADTDEFTTPLRPEEQ